MKTKEERTPRYGVFHLTAGAYSRNGHQEIDFLGDIRPKKPPKDDTFNIDNQTIYLVVGTKEYDQMKSQARNVPEEITIATKRILAELAEPEKAENKPPAQPVQQEFDLGI